MYLKHDTKESTLGWFAVGDYKKRAKVAGMGFYTKIDLGIVKYHFEIGAGKGKEVWG